MNMFKTYHPVMNFIYFVSVIMFSVIFMHPFCIAISFICSLVYLILLRGKHIKLYILLMIAWAIIYPLYNHGGATLLTYLPDGNPLTQQSIVYGIASAVSKTSTLCWFVCCAKVLTTDKLMCVFGKIHPSISLMFSMILRFVPNFINRMKMSLKAQQCIGHNIGKGNMFKKAKIWLKVFSATITWSAENAIDTSYSMKARGYGITKRTSYSIYKFTKRDIVTTITIVFLILYLAFALNTDTNSYSYFPVTGFSIYRVGDFIIYFIFCSLPVLIEIYETLKFKTTVSRIKKEDIA